MIGASGSPREEFSTSPHFLGPARILNYALTDAAPLTDAVTEWNFCVVGFGRGCVGIVHERQSG